MPTRASLLRIVWIVLQCSFSRLCQFWVPCTNALFSANSIPNASTRLLRLPPELRNSIWEYALARYDNEQGTVELTPTDDILPPLARVSKQIYNETKGIWFGRNRFFFCLYDFDGTTFLRFVHLKNIHCPSTTLLPATFSYKNSQARDPTAIKQLRRNLLIFMEALFKGIYAVIDANTMGNVKVATEISRVHGVLSIAQTCFNEGLQWSQAKRIIEIAIETAAICGEIVTYSG